MKAGFLAFIKLIVFILIIPLIIACAIAFQTQILGVPAPKEAWLLWGALMYVGMHLFLYTFKEVFMFGQQMTGKAFSFYAPLVNVAGYIVPVYTIILILGYLLLIVLGNAEHYQGIFLFAVAFSLSMHLVMTAKELYDGDSSPLKAQYFLGFGLLFLVNILVISLLLAWVIPEFSFIGFIKSLAHHTADIYKRIYRVLFVG